MIKKDVFLNARLIAGTIALTFSIPLLQWLPAKFIPDAEYRVLISSIPFILSISLWNNRTRAFSFQPTSQWWKTLFFLLLAVVFGLLLFNVQNQPVSKITGEARSPFEVLEVVILVPIAEEMIFRGVVWSIFEKRSKGDYRQFVVLAATSLLFGVEHLGYWAQTSWPLPGEAYFHAFSMGFAGLFFGLFRLKSNSIAIPAVLHMLANNVILLAQ
jgi:membrane protease YdiL (CAAX protease family)